MLSRLQDLFNGVSDLKRASGGGKLGYGMLADFEDAFHTLPVDPSECGPRGAARRDGRHRLQDRRVRWLGLPVAVGTSSGFRWAEQPGHVRGGGASPQIYDDPNTVVRGSLAVARRLGRSPRPSWSWSRTSLG